MDLAIMGYGVVGSGVARLLARNNESIAARSMQPNMRLKYILDLREFPGDPFAPLVVHDVNLILDDPEIGIVAETMGGQHPAFEFVKACLERGKSVVTSNKELVATKGLELMQTAKAHNVNFLFEASVGGGIPIIRPLSQCLAANVISEVAGILNGTTNFILTKMFADGMPFDTALGLAQENGYAEKDPSADVDGHDACRKICILATLAFGRHVYPEQVRTEGVRGVATEDVLYAEHAGYNIKLIGRARRLEDGRVSAVVGPMLVPFDNLLANVNDVYNAIMIHGDAVEDVIFYGRGAGRFPTASAVVADMIDCAKHTQRRRFFDWETGGADYVAPAAQDVVSLYIRLRCGSPDETFAALRGLLPGAQKLSREGAQPHELALITPKMEEGAALAALRGRDVQSVMRLF
ncbi:MAG: homoserine dehydrogenase [Oscillospiraceae bacterium]|jgi:homoserine dehydrogenase|nr:homoserine dehydrogenase [Oscillospiraceae bacterium]